MNLFIIILFSVTGIFLFLFPEQTTEYASKGLLNWFHNIIPALFPFMILQSVLIGMRFDEKTGKLLKPLLKPLFPLQESAYFAIPIGFLCGFPMGAIATRNLYTDGKIPKKDAELLLAFCNNIGPIYTITTILPLFPNTYRPLILIFMYALPLLYGSIITNLSNRKHQKTKSSHSQRCLDENSCKKERKEISLIFSNALKQAIESILSLGGCMVFFSVMQVLFTLLPFDTPLIKCLGCGLLEIGSFIQTLDINAPYLNLPECFLLLSLVHIGGLSCIMQTMCIISNTNLSIRNYLFHKLILTGIWCFCGLICFFFEVI